MKAQDVIARTAKIIMKMANMEEAKAYQIAERIYADVVSGAIDEEVNRWAMFVYSDTDVQHS